MTSEEALEIVVAMALSYTAQGYQNATCDEAITLVVRHWKVAVPPWLRQIEKDPNER